MRLTRAGEYAVRCVLYLASQESEKVVNRKKIAREMDIPESFLGKIAQQLALSGILEIVQGSKGGLRLRMDSKTLTLLEVVEAVIGEIFLNDCILTPNACHRSRTCAVHRVWEKARNQLRETLREITFADLRNAESCLAPSGFAGDAPGEPMEDPVKRNGRHLKD